MKHNLFVCLSVLLAGLGLTTSCEKDPWVYDTSRKDNIYFVTIDKSDTVKYRICPESWDSTYFTVSFPMELVGMPKDYERVISVAVAEHDTLINTLKPGVDYIIPDDFVLEKGSIRPWFPIHINMDAVGQKDSCWFAVKVVENEHFAPALRDVIQINFKVEHPVYPKWWDETVFGEFSEKKFKLFVNNYMAINDRDPELYRQLWVTYDVFASGAKKPTTFKSGLENLFLDILAKEALVPVFEWYDAHPEYDEESPAWYQRYKETGEINIEFE